MTEEFLNAVDGVASNEQRTRSELVREALRGYIKRAKIANPQRATSNAKLLETLLD
jgi:metal-responsive CopG/Arc/MetJ family transcriptional regulator